MFDYVFWAVVCFVCFPFRKGSEKVWLKYSIRGPMKNAVIRVPIPGSRPVRVPMTTQRRSQPIRTKRNGSFRVSEMTMGIASYTETPRLEVM